MKAPPPTTDAALDALLTAVKALRSASKKRKRRPSVRDALYRLLSAKGALTRKELLPYFPEHTAAEISVVLAKNRKLFRKVPPLAWEAVPVAERRPSPTPPTGVISNRIYLTTDGRTIRT